VVGCSMRVRVSLMECPRCRLTNPEGSLRCDCGFNFDTQAVDTAGRMSERSRRERKPLLSAAAGLLIPFSVVGIVHVIGSAPLDALHWSFLVAASFLFALGVCLWRPIDPLIFGPMLVLSIPGTLFFFAGGFRSGNLFGLVLGVTLIYALIVVVSSAICGLVLRRRYSQKWLPVVAIASALTIVAAGAIKAARESMAILVRLQEIFRAEQVYAGEHPNHSYTCSGPELPGLSGIEWSAASPSLGLTEKSRGRVDGYWITLQCPPSAHPKTFIIRAFGEGRSSQFTLESN